MSPYPEAPPPEQTPAAPCGATHTHTGSVKTTQLTKRNRDSKCTERTNQSHPLGVLQAALEAHVGVPFLRARHTGLHQLLEAVLHLPHVTHLDGNHLPLLERVLLPSLSTATSSHCQLPTQATSIQTDSNTFCFLFCLFWFFYFFFLPPSMKI